MWSSSVLLYSGELVLNSSAKLPTTASFTAIPDINETVILQSKSSGSSTGSIFLPNIPI